MAKCRRILSRIAGAIFMFALISQFFSQILANSAPYQQANTNQSSQPTFSLFRLSVNMIFLFMMLAPLTFYLLFKEVEPRTTPAQFSMMAVAPILGGLALTAASGFKRNQDLILAAQKFILATIGFIVFLISYNTVELIEDIGPNGTLGSTLSISIIYFWIDVVGFYSGIILFLTGLVDLVYALIELRNNAS